MNAIKKHIKGDKGIWAIAFILLAISVPAVYSASALISHKAYRGDMHFLIQQIIAVILASAVIVFSSKINYKRYLNLAKILLPVAVILLFITIVAGVSVNEAKRWIPLPGTGIMIQTSEVAKVLLIMFVAQKLATKKDSDNYEKNIKSATWASVIVIGLIFPADLSSSFLLGLIIFLMFFAAGVKIKSIYKILIAAFVLFVIYTLTAEIYGLPGRFSTGIQRIEAFTGYGKDINPDDTYQSDVSKMAIVNGGLFGKGPGNGTLRYLLPQSHSDFIFSFITEEYGLIAAIIIISLYSVFLYKGIRIAYKSKSLFAIYLVLGYTLMIVLQAFVNIGVSVGALPVTGQTLPLISMGKTSLLVTSFAIGVMLNISKIQKTETENSVDSEIDNETDKE